MENKPTWLWLWAATRCSNAASRWKQTSNVRILSWRQNHRPAYATVACDSGTRQWPTGWTAGVTKQRLRQRHPYPLDILGAESQGMIGYMLQQALKNQLPQREISVLLTQVEVDAHDPAFSNPTKYIGPIYDQTQASALQVEKGWVFKADGKAFRRVVPSPQPKRIVESDAIQALIARDHLVICNGGGGVPVVEKADGYHGIEAVIDKISPPPYSPASFMLMRCSS